MGIYLVYFMVRQERSGRFGSPIQTSKDSETREIKPREIKKKPRIPAGRFGRGLKQTKALQEQAFQLREVRKEAISRANELERDFFSKNITIAQAEEAFGKVDPLVAQFIKTNPEVRRQIAKDAVERLKAKIASVEIKISKLREDEREEDNRDRRRRIEDDLDEQEKLLSELRRLRGQAESGAFRYRELENVAESNARARSRRSRAGRKVRRELRSEGVPTDIITRILNRRGSVTLTAQEAQELTPQARKALGVEIKKSRNLPEGAVASAVGGGFLFNTKDVRGLTTREKFLAEVLGQKTLRVKPIATSITGDVISKVDLPDAKVAKLEPDRVQILQSRLRNNKDLELRERVGIAAQIPEAKIQKEINRISDFAESKNLVSTDKRFELRIKRGKLFGFGRTGGISFGKADDKISKDTLKEIKFSSKEALRTSLDVGRFAVPGFSQVSQITFVSSTAGKISARDKATPLEIGTSVAIVTFPALKFLKEPSIRIREKPSKITTIADTKILNLKQLEKSLDIASVKVVSIKGARRELVVSRAQAFSNRVFGIKRPKEFKTLEKAQIKLGGKIKEIEPSSISLVQTEPFITKSGKVVKPAFRDSLDVAFIATKQTSRRSGKTTIGRFEGALETKSFSLKTIRPEKLSKIDKKIFEEAIRLNKKSGKFKRVVSDKDLKFIVEGKQSAQISKAFPKDASIRFFNVETKDLIRIFKTPKVKKSSIPIETKLLDNTKSLSKLDVRKSKRFKELTAEESARSVIRGRGGAIQKTKLNIELQKQTGLKEVERLSESIAAVDITFPRIPRVTKSKQLIDVKPRKATFIKGDVFRKEIQLPAPKSKDINIQRGIKPKRTKSQEAQLQRLLQTDLNVKSNLKTTDIKTAAGLKSSKIVKTPIKTSSFSRASTRLDFLPSIVGGAGRAKSAFSGRGFDAQLESVISSPKGISKEFGSLKPFSREINLSTTKPSVKLIPREISKNVIKGSAKEITRSSVKLSTKQSTKQSVKLTTKLTTKTTIIPRIPNISIPRSPRSTRKPIIPLNLSTPKRKKRRDRGRAEFGDLALAEGFTARQLGFKPQKIKVADIGKELRKQRGLEAVRLRPLIVNGRKV